MEPLLTNRRIMMWLCVCPAIATSTKWQRFGYMVFTFFIIALNLSGLAASAVFFTKFVWTDLENSLFNIFNMSGHLSVLYMFIILFSSRRKITSLYEFLAELYRARKSWTFKEKKWKKKIFFFIFKYLFSWIKKTRKMIHLKFWCAPTKRANGFMCSTWNTWLLLGFVSLQCLGYHCSFVA